MKIIAVIPARYESVRFPAKVLAKNTGKYLIQHTYEQVLKADLVKEAIIATDSVKVFDACKGFGGNCVMTSDKHQSGTDRIAEAVEKIDADIVINVQGDEPEIDPANINLLAQMMLDNSKADMATLIAKFQTAEQVANPNIVKAVVGRDKFALYFSRSAIPYCRETGGVGKIDDYYRHLGIYAYRKKFLLQLTKLPMGKLEQLEKLEQLRVLEFGYKILTGLVAHTVDGIDTQEQYAEFVGRYKKSKEVKN